VRKEVSETEAFEAEGTLAGFSSDAPEYQPLSAEPVRDVPVDFGTIENTVIRSEPAPVISSEKESFGPAGEIDFSSFDFGGNESEPDTTPPPTLSVDDFTTATEIKSAPAAARKEVPQGLDFSDDDMFGAVVQSTPEVSSNTITFDFEGDSFAESMDMSGQDFSIKGSTSFSLDATSDSPFSLGEIDFGDELTSVAVQQVNPEDLKPSQEILFAPLAEAREKSADDELTRAFLGEEPASDQGELPPLSIASRRKQSPLFGGLIAVVAFLVIAALGYFGYASFSTPKGTVATESGKISIEVLDSSYIENDEVGELLVISGVAFNGYPEPRAALQVKVDLYDATGQSVATKSAYCGNPLTDEQLESLPLNKIEATMANQFGDSLANMEVAPGTAIPFVVVLANLPKGAKDFGVQSVGSTVATGKQQ